MRFLHTADVHLKKTGPERRKILEWLIENLVRFKADALVIAGDLFNDDTESTVLRPEVQGIFQRTRAQIIIIPGNHDKNSYGDDFDYGGNVIQLTRKPFELIELHNIRIAGIPYQEERFSTCIQNLPKDIDLLIAHGTLYDESFIFNYIEDKETQYMPIFPQNLAGLARYIALGHIHSRSIEKKYNNTRVVYPGSPIALDIKCVGPRYVYLVELSKTELRIKPVLIEISPYWIIKEFFLFPGVEDAVVKEIDTFLNDIKNKNVMVNITIRGFCEESDKDFNERIEETEEKWRERFVKLEIIKDIQSWTSLLQNNQIKKFIEHTRGIEQNLRMKILELSLPIFSKMLR